ncbi:PTS transporter subunit EIIB [Erysipelothrix sp. D19-032]
MNNNDLAKNIIDLVGGTDNIGRAAHCMTRLRLNIKDADKVEIDALKGVEGVMGVVESDTLQIVVGPGRAKKVYDIVVEDFGVTVGGDVSSWEDNKATLKSGQKESKLKTGLKTISNIFIPLIPAIIAAGLFSGLASLIGQTMAPTEGFWFLVLKLFQLFSGAFLSYFAIYTGINSAKVFGGTEALGGMIGAMSIMPLIVDISTFFGLYNTEVPLNSVLTTGKGGIIGVIFGVWLMSMIERRVRKMVPDVLDLIVTPLVTLTLTGIIFVLGIMPVRWFLIGWTC